MKKVLTVFLALTLALSATGCKREVVPPEKDVPKGNVATIGSVGIPAEGFSYYFTNFATTYESELSKEFKDFQTEEMEPGKTYLQAAIDFAIDNASGEVVAKALFEEAGMTLTEEDNKAIDDQLTAVTAQFGGEEAFLAAVKDAGMTLEFFKDSIATSVKTDRYMSATFAEGGTEAIAEETLQADFQSRFIRVKHILLKTTSDEMVDGQPAPLDEAGIAAAKKTCDELVAKLNAGGDFDALMTEFGQDPGMVNSPEGYVIEESTSFDPAFLAVAFELDVDKYAVAEGVNGYHIIKRFPLRATDMEMSYIDNTNMYKVRDAVYGQFVSEAMMAKINAYKTAHEPVRDQAVIDSCVKIFLEQHTHDDAAQ